jgi:hypothetical protein
VHEGTSRSPLTPLTHRQTRPAKSGDVDAVIELTAELLAGQDPRTGAYRVNLRTSMERSGAYPAGITLLRSNVDGIRGHRYPEQVPGSGAVIATSDLGQRIITALDETDGRCCVGESGTDRRPSRSGFSSCDGELAEDRLEPAA